MIAAYVRVSSRSQDAATQRAAILRAASARGDAIDLWREEVRSVSRRSNVPRPALDDLRARARIGELRRLYVFRLDRLGRTGIRDTLALVEELRDHGVEVVTLADGFDLGGPAADVVIAVIAWAAQMERAALGERISAARQRVEAAGGSWGRPPRADDVTRQRIYAMVDRGKSVRKIAAALKISRSTVARIVSQKGGPETTPRKASK